MSSLLSYESYVDSCIDIFPDKLGGFAQSGTTIDLAHWFQCYAFVLGEITYSERPGFLDNGDDIAGTMAALDKSMMYSTLKKIDERSRSRNQNVSTTEVAEDDMTPRDFLDKMSDAQQQDPDKVTPYHICMMGLSVRLTSRAQKIAIWMDKEWIW
ncbi:hypothetical protein E8E12_000258 [Didymella heteroderae]|uniref:Uncharacterized protein n=1 Tax=Didymella heteroderae TaxID=1769908 RepID=A0A9P5BY29_9PLEO|nr:hypothetical protein E8E12_000258 [Didymella heteroderae]